MITIISEFFISGIFFNIYYIINIFFNIYHVLYKNKVSIKHQSINQSINTEIKFIHRIEFHIALTREYIMKSTN